MIIVYSTGCPKCKVLIKKLDEKHIDYSICSDIAAMQLKKITQVPVMEVDGELMDFRESVDWINKY